MNNLNQSQTFAGPSDPIGTIKDIVSELEGGTVPTDDIISKAEAAFSYLAQQPSLTERQRNYTDILREKYDAAVERHREKTRVPFSDLSEQRKAEIRRDIIQRVLNTPADRAEQLTAWAERRGQKEGVTGLRDITAAYLNSYVLDMATVVKRASELTDADCHRIMADLTIIEHRFALTDEATRDELARRLFRHHGLDDLDPVTSINAVRADRAKYFEMYRGLLDEERPRKVNLPDVELTLSRIQLLKWVDAAADMYRTGDTEAWQKECEVLRRCADGEREMGLVGCDRFADFMEKCLAEHAYTDGSTAKFDPMRTSNQAADIAAQVLRKSKKRRNAPKSASKVENEQEYHPTSETPSGAIYGRLRAGQQKNSELEKRVKGEVPPYMEQLGKELYEKVYITHELNPNHLGMLEMEALEMHCAKVGEYDVDPFKDPRYR